MSKKGKHSSKEFDFSPSIDGRVRGVLMLLLTALLLLAGQRYAFAQSNTPGGPYIDSWHQYEVTMGDFNNNTYQWSIQDAETSPTTQYNVDGSEAWVDVSAGATNTINIKFINALFSAGQTWYLIYSEFSANTCIARRSFQMDLAANSFYLNVDAGTTTCNSFAGSVWENDVATLTIPERVSTVEFTINMVKTADFATDGWSCSGNLSFVTVNSYDFAATIFPSTIGTSTNGTWTITDNGSGSFDLQVNAANDGTAGDAVTFTVQVEGEITQNFQLRLTLSNGQAQSGDASTYVVRTDDNGTGPLISDQTVLGVPNTSVITVTP